MRFLIAVLAVALAASVAAGETFARNDKMTVAGPRLHSGAPRPFPGVVFSSGGPEIRFLAPGARRWKTLFKQRRGVYSTVAFDVSSARVLAAWTGYYDLHYSVLGSGKVKKIPVLGASSREFPNIKIRSIKFAPNGRDALVYLTQSRNRLVVFRVALDGKSKPKLLIPPTKGFLLHSSSRGAVLAVPGRDIHQRCGRRDCLGSGARIVAYEISGRGVRKKTLFRHEQVAFRTAHAVPGGDDRHAIVELGLTWPRDRAILRYRYGDAEAFYKKIEPIYKKSARNVDAVLRPVRWSTVSLSRNAFLYLLERKSGLEVRIQPLTPAGRERIILLPVRYRHITELFGFGARPDGSVWIHWGDHLLILDANDTARSVNLKPIQGKGVQWAGVDAYAENPESLWIGIEISGKGRHYARVNFSEVEKKATPWPQASARPRGCERLPAFAMLKKWRVHRETPCHGGARNPRAPPFKPYEVFKVLPDGTKIVDGRELGCIRVRKMGCFNRCLPPNARIATPKGEIQIDALRVGMSVWTQDVEGDRVPGKVIKTHRQHVPETHAMVSIRLADQRSLLVSSGHPDAAGYGLEKLKRGQVYDGSQVVDAAVVGYGGSRTLDILPSGETGIYWANGIPIGSTLWRPRE